MWQAALLMQFILLSLSQKATKVSILLQSTTSTNLHDFKTTLRIYNTSLPGGQISTSIVLKLLWLKCPKLTHSLIIFPMMMLGKIASFSAIENLSWIFRLTGGKACFLFFLDGCTLLLFCGIHFLVLGNWKLAEFTLSPLWLMTLLL